MDTVALEDPVHHGPVAAGCQSEFIKLQLRIYAAPVSYASLVSYAWAPVNSYVAAPVTRTTIGSSKRGRPNLVDVWAFFQGLPFVSWGSKW